MEVFSDSCNLQQIRNGRHLIPMAGVFRIISWNIQGYSEDKLATLQQFMKSNGIGIACVQETHKFSSEYFITPEGFLCIFSSSASAEDKNTDAGVATVHNRSRSQA